MNGTDRKKLIVIAGPTAAGKSAAAVKTAQMTGGEIISADSMQVYRYMDIGTAKIMPEEQEDVPHYLIDVCDPDDPYDVFRFQKDALNVFETITEKGKIPILCGGNGFYIQALTRDIHFDENHADTAYREELLAIAKYEGPQVLHAMLSEIDPASAGAIHPNNVHRIVRALEFYHETGSSIFDHNREERSRPSPYDLIYIVLSDERPLLYSRIEKRTDQMMKEGFPEEVESLRKMGYGSSLASMNGLGYKELNAYFDGHVSFDEAVRLIKRNTRHYAKRQLTWFRRESDTHWILRNRYGDSTKLIAEEIIRIIKENWKDLNEN